MIKERDTVAIQEPALFTAILRKSLSILHTTVCEPRTSDTHVIRAHYGELNALVEHALRLHGKGFVEVIHNSIQGIDWEHGMARVKISRMPPNSKVEYIYEFHLEAPRH